MRYKPITVNIEVKPPDCGQNDATMQLKIWATAQFNKLNDLSDGEATFMIPLVLVEGHDGRIFIAFRNTSGEVVRLTFPCRERQIVVETLRADYTRRFIDHPRWFTLLGVPLRSRASTRSSEVFSSSQNGAIPCTGHGSRPTFCTCLLDEKMSKHFFL